MDSKISKEERDSLLEKIKKPMKTYMDFPKPGINFVDVFSIFGDV